MKRLTRKYFPSGWEEVPMESLGKNKAARVWRVAYRVLVIGDWKVIRKK